MTVVAYAQAAHRQGIDAAIGGVVVDPEGQLFGAFRRRSMALNLEANAVRVGDVEVRVGAGLVRIQFDGADFDGETGSPIVVLVEVSALDGGLESIARSAQESVSAIGRMVSSEGVLNGLLEAARIIGVSRRRRRIEVALVVGVAVVATATWISWDRTSRKARNLSDSPWTR